MKNWLKTWVKFQKSGPGNTLEETFKTLYGAFQDLLSSRKKALEMLDAEGLSIPPPLLHLTERALECLNKISLRRRPDLLQTVQETLAGIRDGSSTAEEDRALRGLLNRIHDLAMEEMFALLDQYDLSKLKARRVQTGLPINLHVVDLGDGLSSEADGAKWVQKEQILSQPMQALLKGMIYPGISWSGPIGVNLKGFMVIMAQSSSRPEEDLWDKTYALVAREYMNYNSRLGYHYSSVDAYLSQDPECNHLSFMFKGGAADDLRRNRRARFIGAVLERLGLEVKVEGDLVSARLRRREGSVIAERLDLIGRLMGCSRQRDMVMGDESSVRWYTEAFLRGNYAFDPDQ